jgi:hypothetical protein
MYCNGAQTLKELVFFQTECGENISQSLTAPAVKAPLHNPVLIIYYIWKYHSPNNGSLRSSGASNNVLGSANLALFMYYLYSFVSFLIASPYASHTQHSIEGWQWGMGLLGGYLGKKTYRFRKP